jgi:hypothetical protein
MSQHNTSPVSPISQAVESVKTLIASGVPAPQAAEVVSRLMTAEVPSVMTFDEACVFLRLTRERLHAEIAARNIKAKKVSREIIVITRRSVLAWLGEPTA